MNIFTTGDGIPHELTRENFINRTHKKSPFYQDPKIYKKPYFAICPVCNNPIQIINLYGVQYEEEKTGKTSLHGRHYTRNVKGLPDYNKANYDRCCLHNPVAFRISKLRNDVIINNEIREMVDNNRSGVISDIKSITCIFFKNERINGIINNYITARDYCYTHTNKYNIPYSILYTREALDLFGQKINLETVLGEKIKSAITEKSRYFCVESGRITKKVAEYVSIHLLVSHHRVNGSKQYMTLSVEEKYGENTYIIIKEEIEMRQYMYC